MNDKNLLVGIKTSDDAAVYKISNNLAIIHTIDFFTPVVDDPYAYGQIAACNALSDIYAMGGEPFLALNIVGVPEEFTEKILPKVLKGGADKVIEAGAIIGGGHSIKSPEPFYGLSVLGRISPSKIITNSTAKPGDALILTKPIGVGIITTSLKVDMVGKEAKSYAIETMAKLNKRASKIALEIGVNSITDITGFGLLGHSLEMASSSEVTLKIRASALPILPEAKELATMGMLPAGLYQNKNYLQNKIKISSGVSETIEDIAFDPQTSGGLLISVSKEKAKTLLKLLQKEYSKSSIIGEVMEPLDYGVLLVE